MGKIKNVAGLVAGVIIVTSFGLGVYLANKPEAPRSVQTSGPDQSAQVVTPDALLAAINAERSKAGVPALRLDPRLNGSAQRKVDEIESEGRQPNVHLNKVGIHGFTYAIEAMPECRRTSENVVWGFQNSKDKVAVAIDTWMKSPPHRSAILNPVWVYTGFGVGQNDSVEHFCQV